MLFSFTKSAKKPPPPAAPVVGPAIPPSCTFHGYHHNPETGERGNPLVYKGERHILLFGPNGSGKGARLLIPNLLNLTDRSIVVIDPKGELAAATADYRRTVSDVVILNPFNALGLGSTGFNPLAALDPDSATFFDDATRLGEALIKLGEGKELHWTQGARSIVVALMMYEVMAAKQRGRAPSLVEVRHLLTEPDLFDEKPGRKKPVQIAGLAVTAQRICRVGTPAMQSLASRFMAGRDEIRGIQSTADGQTWWLLSEPMRDHLGGDGFDFRRLKERPTTVYVVLPAEYMTTHAVWLRLVLVSALSALFKPGGLSTLFMLDEFAQLGHLSIIDDSLALLRGYGIQLWPVVQDLNQLKYLYKDRWESLVSNAGLVQAFAPNDRTTAEWMSKQAGETTIVAEGYNTGDGQTQTGVSSNRGLSYQQVKRPLLLPQELIAMEKGTGLLWVANAPEAIPFTAPFYEEIPELHARAGDNPYRRRKPHAA